MPSASMAAISPYIGLAGAGVSAIGSLTAGQGASNADNYNAAIEQRRADQVIQLANVNAQQQSEQTKRTLAQATANYGAAGVDASSGTPLEVFSDISTQGELARQLIQYKGAVEAETDREQAALDLMKASSAKTSSYFQAGSTLLTGFGKYGMNKYTPSSPGGGGGGASIPPEGDV